MVPGVAAPVPAAPPFGLAGAATALAGAAGGGVTMVAAEAVEGVAAEAVEGVAAAASAAKLGGVFGLLLVMGLAMVRAGGDWCASTAWRDRAGISTLAGSSGGGSDAGSEVGVVGGDKGGGAGQSTVVADASAVAAVSAGELAHVSLQVELQVELAVTPTARVPLHLTLRAATAASFLLVDDALFTESAMKLARADLAATIQKPNEFDEYRAREQRIFAKLHNIFFV